MCFIPDCRAFSAYRQKKIKVSVCKLKFNASVPAPFVNVCLHTERKQMQKKKLKNFTRRVS